MAATRKKHKPHQVRASVSSVPVSSPAAVPIVQPPLSVRLQLALKEAERNGFAALAEALNAAIVALSDAKEKAHRGSAMGAKEPYKSLFAELGSL